MKRIILALLLVSNLAFGQTTKTALMYINNRDIRNQVYSPKRMASLLDSMIASFSLVGAGSNYTGTSPTTTTVGGLSSGSAIAGLSISSILQSILVPYVNPSFSSFSVSGQSTTVEVGTTLSGSKTFTWGITLGSGTVSTINIYDVTAGANLLAGTPNDGSQAVTITSNQLNSNGSSQAWRGVGNDTGGGPATFNSSNFTVTGRYYRFWDAVSSAPTNSAGIRALTSAFHTGATTFTLNTGTTNIIFFVALPPGVTISSVVDLDALGADITANYVAQSSINVTDAGGTARAYSIFKMVIGSPYASSHRHSITTAN